MKAHFLKVLLPAFLVLASGSSSLEAEGQKNKPITLYGHIDELSYICSSTGLKLSQSKNGSIVEKISLGSAAAYSGLRTGDKILATNYDENAVSMRIERKGRIYETRIATNVKGLKDEFETRKIKFSFGDSAFDKELKKLRDVKVVIMLDRSLSMAETHAGVPGDLSKWTWCKEQIDNLYLATDRVLDEGFDIVLFNDRTEGRQAVTLFDLRQVFDSIKPQGEHKNIATPLNAVLSDYLSRRNLKSKPCIVLVITDGIENIGPPLQDVLIEASKKLTRQGELLVTFMQVGQSISGEELFEDLDRNLVAKGAKFKMADYITFAELRNRGVLPELLNCLKDISPAAQKK
ncbi:MAG: hypothetical protein K2X27_05655 [Candidatus Obscuribacterales bacterium]|nr:hypothetical protein [Candidatus Obscuribacterales bacterium]